jgi:transposase
MCNIFNMAYTTDLSTKEYQIILPLLPVKLSTRPAIWSKHQILNAIFYQLVNGCRWVDLPKDLPPTGTVFHYFNTWKKEGVWDLISKEIFIKSRINQGKKRMANTVTIRLSSRR